MFGSDQIGALFVKISADVTEFQAGIDGVTEKLQQGATGWASNVSEFATALKPAGELMAGFGAAVTGVMAFSVGAAIEEQTALNRLKIQLENTGVAYNDVAAAITAQVDAAVLSTNYSEEDQWNALSALIMVTGDYEQALKLLPTAMDLASAKGMDLTSSATLLGRVAEGNTSILTRYGITMKEGATAGEALDAIQGKVAGSAEAMANPMKVLQNGIGEVGDKIGMILLPLLKSLVDFLMPCVVWIQNFSAEHPLLAKVIVIAAAAIGLIALAVGGLILLLPTIIAGVTALTTVLPILGAAFTIALGPVGLIIAAIAALIAIVLLCWKYHEQIADFFQAVWARIKEIFWAVVDWIKEWGLYFLGPIGMIIENWSKIKDFFVGLWDGIKSIFFGGVNAVIDVINVFIRAYNSIPILGNISEIGHLGEGGGGGGATAEMDAALEEGRRQQAAADAAVAAQNAAMAAAQDAAAAQYMADSAAATAQGYEMIGNIGFGGYQHGGIAIHPQIATLAEHEPELITPFSVLADLFAGGRRGDRGGGGDTIIHVHVGGNIMAASDLADIIRDQLFKVRNRNVAVGLT